MSPHKGSISCQRVESESRKIGKRIARTLLLTEEKHKFMTSIILVDGYRDTAKTVYVEDYIVGKKTSKKML